METPQTTSVQNLLVNGKLPSPEELQKHSHAELSSALIQLAAGLARLDDIAGEIGARVGKWSELRRPKETAETYNAVIASLKTSKPDQSIVLEEEEFYWTNSEGDLDLIELLSKEEIIEGIKNAWEDTIFLAHLSLYLGSATKSMMKGEIILTKELHDELKASQGIKTKRKPGM